MNIIKTLRKIIIRLTLVLAGMVLSVILLLQLPWVQNLLARKVAGMISEQVDVTLEVDRFRLASFNRVNLKNVLLTGPGEDTLVAFSRFDARIRIIPLFRNEVQVGRIRLNDPYINLEKQREDSLLNIVSIFQQGTPGKPEPKGNQPPWSFHFEDLTINRMDFRYTDRLEGSTLSVLLDGFNVVPDTVNLEERKLLFKYIGVRGLALETGRIEAGKVQPAKQEGNRIRGEKSFPEGFPWDIGISELEMEKNQLVFAGMPGDQENPGESEVFSLTDLSVSINDLNVSGGEAHAEIAGFQALIDQTYRIDELSTLAELTGQSASLEELQLRTLGARIGINARLQFPGLSRLTSSPADTRIVMDVEASSDSASLSHFFPGTLPLRAYPPVRFNTSLRGSLKELIVDSLVMDLGQALSTKLSGHFSGLTDTVSPPRGNLTIHMLSVNEAETRKYLPDTLFPDGLDLPGAADLQGIIMAEKDSLLGNLVLGTGYGSVRAEAGMHRDTATGRENINMQLYSEGFALDSLLQKEDTLGNLAFNVNIAGTTRNFGNPDLNYDITLAGFQYMGYTYSDFIAAGRYSGDTLQLHAAMNDENLSFMINGHAHFPGRLEGIALEAELNKAELAALELSDESTRLGGSLKTSLTGSRLRNIRGYILLSDAYYIRPEQSFRTERIRWDMEGDSVQPVYHMHIANLWNNDSLFTRDAEITARVESERTLFSGNAMVRNLPRSTKQFIPVSVDGYVHSESGLLRAEGDLFVNDRGGETASRYDVFLSRAQQTANNEQYAFHFTGESMNIEADARVYGDLSARSIEGSVSLDSLDLHLFEPVLRQYLVTLEGRLSGKLSASGPLDDPYLEGLVTFHNTVINPTALQTPFLMRDETARLEGRQLELEGLTLEDKRGNKAMLKGMVNLEKTATSNFDLSLNAKRFQMVDKPESQGDLYYGNVLLDMQGNVTGTFEEPVINLMTTFDQESNFTFIVPKSATPTGEGVFRFVNDTASEVQNPEDSVSVEQRMRANSMSLEIDAGAELTDRFTLSVITNPLSGETLEIRGNGNLGFQLNRGGTMGLTGRYTISEGQYQLILFDIMKRNFKIEEGSTLSWSGEMLEAMANISAVYRVHASPDHLMEYERFDRGEASSDAPVPIEVVMNLNGPLLTPEIDFDLRADEEYSGSNLESVLSRLNRDESELNKQVFSLLLFNRFMSGQAASADPMAYTISNQSRQSVSALLSKQLDRFAARYIKGVDLDVTIQSYETEMNEEVAARTDVNMDVSTDLFNDRLTLEVGGAMNVKETGGQEKNLEAGQLAGDFRASYKLTPDGRYLLTIFNETDYEGELDGEVTKTGVSFIFQRDFVSFRDLFENRRKEEGADE